MRPDPQLFGSSVALRVPIGDQDTAILQEFRDRPVTDRYGEADRITPVFTIIRGYGLVAILAIQGVLVRKRHQGGAVDLQDRIDR